MNVGEMITAARDAVMREIEAAFKTLLEEKHLYQSLRLDLRSVITRAVPEKENLHPLDQQSAGNARAIVAKSAARRWLPNTSREAKMTAAVGYEKPIHFDVPPVRLFCETCGRLERFELVRGEDYSHDPYGQPSQKEYEWKSDDQAFVLTLLCLSCQRFPETFLVRRVAAKQQLILSGRSPIECVEVPASVPKEETNYFRDAVVAYQTGRPLAGLFFLRTLIEQFARRVTSDQTRQTGQAIMSAYAETLPVALRGSMPSFGECYEQISDALHSARPDETLFLDMRAKIVQHFDFRRAAQLTP